MKHLTSILSLIALAMPAQGKPLKVFILAGQSNMQGHAEIGTFDFIGDDAATAPILKEMRDAEGKPKVCEKVWISSVGCLGDAYTDLKEKKGKLTAGFGAPDDKIGPEFTFGIYMEKQLGEPILLIKTAWGGRSLHTDFRPPSGGQVKRCIILHIGKNREVIIISLHRHFIYFFTCRIFSVTDVDMRGHMYHVCNTGH